MYCSKCGSAVEEGAAFCPACGQSTSSSPVATSAPAPPYPGGSYPPLTPPVAAPVMAYAPSVQYAGFWLRVVAYIIDGIVVGLAFLALFIPFAFTTGLAALAARVHAGDDPRDIGEALGPVFFLGFFTIVSLAFLAHGCITRKWKVPRGRPRWARKS